MTSEVLGGQLQSCYTARARPKGGSIPVPIIACRSVASAGQQIGLRIGLDSERVLTRNTSVRSHHLHAV